jgi:hypothetical protein
MCDYMLMDGYDDCIIGVCERMGQEPIVAYSYEKVIAKLTEDQVESIAGLTDEEAIEWFEYNMIGAWVGEKTPCFIRECPDDLLECLEERKENECDKNSSEE